MKRGLVYIGGPKQLKDFIWYYLYKGKEYEWTLICQPMFPEMNLREVCEKSGIFKEIIMVKPYVTRSLFEKAWISLEMFFYWIIGRNKQYALKEINKIANLEDFDLVCSPTTRGVTPGMLVLATDNVPIDMLEDSIGDTTNESAKFEITRLFEKGYFVAYFFAKMGYFNLHNFFPIESTKKCDRYSEIPDNISRNEFRNVYRLNDFSKVDVGEYYEYIEKTFGFIENLDDIEAILFTTPLEGFSSKYEECNAQVLSYLYQKGYRKIAIKKHPRDVKQYRMEGVEIVEINSMIPAENILERISDKMLYFMYSSSTLKKVTNKENAKVFRFGILSNCLAYQNGLKKGSSMFDVDKSMIIDL